MISYCLFQSGVSERLRASCFSCSFSFLEEHIFKNIIDQLHFCASCLFIERACFRNLPRTKTILVTGTENRGKQLKCH